MNTPLLTSFYIVVKKTIECTVAAAEGVNSGSVLNI